jgi:hypothetical protein
MPEAEIARTVQLLDLMLDFFAHDGHWTRGSYDDGNGGHFSHPQLREPRALEHLGVDHVRVTRWVSLDRLRNFTYAEPESGQAD